MAAADAENDLKQLVADQNLHESVTFLGELGDEEAIGWYQQSDLFILPNRKIGNEEEGFGIVLLEAQACGTPVLAGDSGGTREALDHGHTGYVLDCRNPELIAEKVIEMLDDRQQLLDMGVAGREFVERNFDWSVIINKARHTFLGSAEP